jgi:hypothetical protein
LDDRIRKMLKELGDAINESISASAEVNEHIQRIRDEGYNLYVVLDATIGLDRDAEEQDEDPAAGSAIAPGKRKKDIQFRIDVNDLSFLKSVGIDPTRKVKAAKRLELPAPESSEPS